VVLQKTPFSFDVSVWEFFWPLLAGARLVVARPGAHRDPAYLRDIVITQHVTTMHFVPSMLAVFVDEQRIEECQSLRRVICSGEALPFSLQEKFFARFDAVALHNLYGPTEAAIDVTSWECERESRRRSVPIGRPISNTEIYVLDDEMRVVPVGVRGELYIGGRGIGPGYLNRAGLTAERFVPHPFSDERGARLYRTGDVCYRQEDGRIEYVERKDYQVKVRGHRIELGEIEAALERCPGVKDCVVVAHTDSGSETRLMAYVVPAEQPVSVSDWREQLQKQLPEYMIPAVFVKLEELPLTPSGKVDRRALPAVETGRPMLGSAYAAPCTPLEELLVVIWSEVLDVTPVGVLDNFFELGGDSIRSIQILARAQKEGIAFTLQQLFQHPTIRDLARVAGIQADQSEASELKEFDLISENDRQRLPDDVEDAYPLTQLQAGMIFHSEYSPATAVYHDIFAFHIRARFDSQVLETVLRELLARHPVLRTSFDLTQFSEPLQLVHRSVAAPLQVDDLRGASPERQTELLAAWNETEKSRNFDWAQAPLIRVQVHLRSEDSFQFTLSFHHTVLDGWSVASMLAEVFLHYASLMRGESTPAQLTPPVAKFSDLVALERAALESEECQNYWDKKLRESSFIKIPRWRSLARPLDAAQTRTHPVQIRSDLSRKLIEVARDASVPLKSVLLAAHLRVMKLLSGQSDVLTGLVSNGRPEITDGERVLGLFLNALPFRLHMEGGTWAELLQATFEAERELLPFRRYPMAQMQKQQGGQALFEAGFNFNHFHLFKSLPNFAEMEIVDGNVFEATNYVLTANFALDVFSSEIQLALFYNAGELADDQVIGYGNYYIRALEAIANHASARYEQANLLAADEERQLLYEWNVTSRDDQAPILPELFEAQVGRTPEAVAVVFEGEEVSYRELNERANQLAHHLQSLGVREETLVGIMMERSLEMVVSLLAVLKAGGAYVPLDPEYPKARVSFMLADAGVSVLLTQARFLGEVERGGARVVSVDSEWEMIGEQSRENPARTTSAENLAYVIYTSGSTGRPNGVLIHHNSVANLIQQARSIFQVDSHSRVLHVASFSFDASVLELFLALGSGASLYLCSSTQRLLPDEVDALVRGRQLTTAVLTPSLLKVLDHEQCRSLRTISSGGERLTADVAERWSSADRQMLNCYGPTEATIFATYAKCPPENERATSTAPPRAPAIGRGVENVPVYVLDAAMAVVPVGVIGELYIGGAGVARGYLGRADLTAERFLPDPYSGVAGARMYRTGDNAKWRREGELEYVGRRDEQVKIRGQRLELAEVEAILRKQEGVRECAVVLRNGMNGEQRLIAYVVAEKPLSLNPGNETTGKSSVLSERIELCPSVAEYFVYDDYLYDTLTHDERRNNKYRAVINRHVKNKVVLDIGTGPDAILARLCIEGGAKRVYAIEVLEQTYRQAVATIKKMGLDDRIILIHGDSTQVQLPELVDVCVSEIVGSIGGSEGAAPIINSAHRWLKPDGVMIPERSRTRVAAASLPDELLENPGFSEMGANYVAKIFEQVGHPFDLRLCIRNFPESHLISEAAIFEDLNFTEQVATEYRREIHLHITRKGKLDGLLVWLNLQLGEGELIDILEPGYSWFPIYFPVFYPGVEVDEGDAIVAVCSGRPSGNGINPDYRIEGKLVRRDGSEIEFDYQSGHHETRYRHEAFYRLIFGEDGAIRKREQAEVTSKRLRAELKRQLPDYMIPQSFLVLDELPLTPTGKIDRKSLPAPETIRSQMERPYIAPRTLLEQRLTDIWSHLLGIQQISIHDSFFDLGGHSLLSTRLISQLRQTFAVEISLRRFFEIPTIAMLAAEIEKLTNSGEGITEAVIKSLPRESRRMKRSSLAEGNP
jgi:amino acid adenylation domain-containing protein